MRVVAFGASVHLVACAVANSVSLSHYQKVAVAAVLANDADSAGTAAAAADVVAIESIHLVAVPAPSNQVRKLVSSCTGCPSWSNACMASPPRTSDADRHMLHMLVRHDCVG